MILKSLSSAKRRPIKTCHPEVFRENPKFSADEVKIERNEGTDKRRPERQRGRPRALWVTSESGHHEAKVGKLFIWRTWVYIFSTLQTTYGLWCILFWVHVCRLLFFNNTLKMQKLLSSWAVQKQTSTIWPQVANLCDTEHWRSCYRDWNKTGSDTVIFTF